MFVLALACCTERFPSRYVLELPQVPEPWVSLLGEPNWRVEWVTPDGRRQTADYTPGMEIEIPVTWANPVTASPYWHNVLANTFKPCGALFPFDAIGGSLRLSWDAGIDSVFYWELVYANNQNRIPANFDWPRFRELFQSGVLSEAVLEDPWLVNWRTLAERTAESNFDRRRIVPEAAELKSFPVPAGLWYGTSPFAAPLFFEAGEQPVFPVRPGINVWISEKGILRVNGNTWMFIAN